MNAELVCVETSCENCQESIYLPHDFHGMDIRASMMVAFCDQKCHEEYNSTTFPQHGSS